LIFGFNIGIIIKVAEQIKAITEQANLTATVERQFIIKMQNLPHHAIGDGAVQEQNCS